MPRHPIRICLKMKKCFSNLSFFDGKLIIIADREPLCSAIKLKPFGKRNFDRRLLYNFDLLSLIMRLFGFKYANSNDTSRYTSSGDNNLFPIRSGSESFTREDKLIDPDVIENFIFWHRFFGILSIFESESIYFEEIHSFFPRAIGSVPTKAS